MCLLVAEHACDFSSRNVDSVQLESLVALSNATFLGSPLLVPGSGIPSIHPGHQLTSRRTQRERLRAVRYNRNVGTKENNSIDIRSIRSDTEI